MNDHVEAYSVVEERSTTTDYSVSMDIEPEQQIPSTVELTTYVEPLPSTIEMKTESTMDLRTESDESTSFMDVSSAYAQVIMPAGNDPRDYCNVVDISFVYAFERNPDPRIVMMPLFRLLR